MSIVPVSQCVSNVLKELEQKHRFMWNFVLCFCFLFFNKPYCTCVLKIPLYQIVPFTGYYVHLIASLNEGTSLTIKKSIIKTPEGRAILRAVLTFYSQS